LLKSVCNFVGHDFTNFRNFHVLVLELSRERPVTIDGIDAACVRAGGARCISPGRLHWALLEHWLFPPCWAHQQHSVPTPRKITSPQRSRPKRQFPIPKMASL